MLLISSHDFDSWRVEITSQLVVNNLVAVRCQNRTPNSRQWGHTPAQPRVHVPSYFPIPTVEHTTSETSIAILQISRYLL